MLDLSAFHEVPGGLSEPNPKVVEIGLELPQLQSRAPGLGGLADLALAPAKDPPHHLTDQVAQRRFGWGRGLFGHRDRLHVLEGSMSRVRALFATGYGLTVLVGAIGSALVLGTVLALPFAWIPRGRRERHTLTAAWCWARTVLASLGTTVVITGDSGLSDEDGALLLCNHRSWLDPLVLMAALRSNGLSKLEILYIPVVGFYGWLTGAVFFDRRNRIARQRARDEVMKLVRGGTRVQVFPEGTRSRDGRLSEKVHLTLAMDCWRARCPIVPCAVWGTERVLPVGRPEAWPGQTVWLDVGPALFPRDYANEEAFAQAAWGAVVARVRDFERSAGVPRAGLEPALP